MALVTKISVKDFNIEKLQEELAALPIVSFSWAGFTPLSARVVTPFPEASRQVGYSSNTGADTAQKGELRFTTSRNLTGAEDTSLTSLLAAHVSTVLTAEQVRQDQDTSDLDALVATDRAAFLQNLTDMQTIINNWDAQTTAQKLTSAKQFFVETRENMVTIGKVLRLYIRRERGAAI